MTTISIIRTGISPQSTRRIADRASLEPADAVHALDTVLPAVVADIIGTASSGGGRDVFARLMASPEARGIDEAVAQIEADVEGIAIRGNDALAWLLGRNRQWALVLRLASHAGTSRATAALLVGVAASLTLAALRQRVAEAGNGARDVRLALEDETQNVMGAIPAEFAAALRGSGVLVSVAEQLWTVPSGIDPHPAPEVDAIAATRREGEVHMRPSPPVWMIGTAALMLLAIWLLVLPATEDVHERETHAVHGSRFS